MITDTDAILNMKSNTDLNMEPSMDLDPDIYPFMTFQLIRNFIGYGPSTLSILCWMNCLVSTIAISDTGCPSER